MPITDHFLTWQKSKLHYTIAGTGSHAMLVFPGFGQGYHEFDNLVQAYHDQYTFYIFDLYFSGKSEWNEGEKPLEKDQWCKFLRLFLEQTKLEAFSVLGFSIGARFALATFEAYPEKIRSLYLIAPDGISTNFWYWFATYPLLTRRLFKGMITRSGLYFSVANTLTKLHIVDRVVARFAESQMNSEEKRKHVYYSWVVFRHLKFNFKKLVHTMNHFGIRVEVVIGANDKVVAGSRLKSFAEKVNNGKLTVLKASHLNLIHQLAGSGILNNHQSG